MNSFSLCLVILIVGICDCLLPPNVPVCHRSDPKISECVIRAVSVFPSRLASGDLGGGFKVPPLDPFVIKKLNFGEERGLRVYLSDLQIHGIPKFKISKLRVNIEELRFDVFAIVPKLDIHGKYKMSMNFLGSNVNSEGDYSTQYIGCKIKIQMKGVKYLKNGVEYMKFEPFGIKFNRGKEENLKITNLFNGNRVLGEIVHALILYDENFAANNFYPQIEAGLSKSFTSIANKIIEQSPFDELMPL